LAAIQHGLGTRGTVALVVFVVQNQINAHLTCTVI
jgi:hypothetical protein